MRGLGCPARSSLTVGQRGDAPQAATRLDTDKPGVVTADAGYRADHCRAAIADNPSRARKCPFDNDLHNERHLVECCFSKLQRFRRGATRDQKTAQNFLAVIHIAATILRIR